MRNTQRSHARTTKRKHSVSGTYQTHMRADRHTQNQDWTSSTVAHISFLTVNDSWCLGFKIPYECIDLPLCFSATHETNERVRLAKKGGWEVHPVSHLSIHRNFPMPLCLLVFLSVCKPFIGSQAEWWSKAEQHPSWTALRALSTDGGGYDGTGLRVSPFHPSCSLPVGQWRKKCEKNRWKERGVRKQNPRQVIITTLTY